MFKHQLFITKIIILYLALTASSSAGMTVVTLRDIADARIQSISFFIFLYLVLALAVKALWNYLGKSFDWMPQINFRRALCLMLVSGLFLYVILTMISGARELLTPGAWEKQGVSYKLKDKENLLRERKIEALKNHLWGYAEKHNGTFPLSINITNSSNRYFTYMSGRKMTDGYKILAYESAITGKKRLVLFCDGRIDMVKASDVPAMIRNEKERSR